MSNTRPTWTATDLAEVIAERRTRRDTLARECCAENRSRLLAVAEAVQRVTQNIDLERKERK